MLHLGPMRDFLGTHSQPPIANRSPPYRTTVVLLPTAAHPTPQLP